MVAWTMIVAVPQERKGWRQAGTTDFLTEKVRESKPSEPHSWTSRVLDFGSFT